MVNASQAQEIANLILSAALRDHLPADRRVGPCRTSPAAAGSGQIDQRPRRRRHRSPSRSTSRCRPGTIVARTDRVPFPQANISSVLEYRSLRDTAQFDYGISRVANTAGGGPRKEFEIRSIGRICGQSARRYGRPVKRGLTGHKARAWGSL